MLANTIDEVIQLLDDIIEENKNIPSTLGYFAALYQKVTCKVKEGITNNFFEDGERMERLDVIFANRYLEAYHNYKNNEETSKSWLAAFDEADNYWIIVLQHLLLGMNAHINLDLGIAAATVSEGHDINNLKGDFDRINIILADLVHDVEKELSLIWNTLTKILKHTEKFDAFLIDFSMRIARDGAWKFAVELANAPKDDWTDLIEQRDITVANKTHLVIDPGFFIGLLLKIIRLEEKGSIKKKIEILQKD